MQLLFFVQVEFGDIKVMVYLCLLDALEELGVAKGDLVDGVRHELSHFLLRKHICIDVF